MATPKQWHCGTPSARIAAATVGAIVAISTGIYMCSSTCKPVCTRAKRRKLEGSMIDATASDEQTEILKDFQPPNIEELAEPCKTTQLEDRSLREQLEERETILSEQGPHQEVEANRLEGDDRMKDLRNRIDLDETEDQHRYTKEVVVQSAAAVQTVVRHQDDALTKSSDSKSSEEEMKKLKRDLEYLVGVHEKELKAVESKFLTEYGPLEDDVEALLKENQVLHGHIAQANANVEGLKMQMETAAESAEDSILGMEKKLQEEQADFNKLEDDRDYLREEKDALLKEVKGLREFQVGLQKEKCDLIMYSASLEGRAAELERELTECSQQLTLITEKVNVETRLRELIEAQEKIRDEVEQGDAAAPDCRDESVGTNIVQDGRGGFSEEKTPIASGAKPEEERQTLEDAELHKDPCKVGIEWDKWVGSLSKTGFVRGTEFMGEGGQAEDHIPKKFRKKVEDIEKVLGQCQDNSSNARAETALWGLVEQLYDLLHQMPFAKDNASTKDETLRDNTSGQSSTDLVAGKQYFCDGKTDEGSGAPSEEHDDMQEQGSEPPSSLPDTVKGGDNEKTLQTKLLDQNESGGQKPQLSLPRTRRNVSASVTSDAKPKLKSSRWRNWSSRSKGFLSGPHGPSSSRAEESDG